MILTALSSNTLKRKTSKTIIGVTNMSYYDDWLVPIMIDPDYIIEQEEEERERENKIESNRHIGWTTAKGDLIPYYKMTTRHLINCKNMCERKKPWRKNFLPYLNTELKRRGVL